MTYKEADTSDPVISVQCGGELARLPSPRHNRGRFGRPRCRKERLCPLPCRRHRLCRIHDALYMLRSLPEVRNDQDRGRNKYVCSVWRSLTQDTESVASQTCYETCWKYRQECSALEGNESLLLPICELSGQDGKPLYPPEVSHKCYNKRIDPLTYGDKASLVEFPDGSVSLPCTRPQLLGPFGVSRCESFAGFPSECTSVVRWPVLVPAGSSQQQLAADARLRLVGMRAAQTSCREQAILLICASMFEAGTSIQIDEQRSLGVGKPVCQSFCKSTFSQCQKVRGPDKQIDCRERSSSGSMRYPEEDSVVEYGNMDSFINCTVPEYAPGAIYPKIKKCPFPTVLTDDDEDVCELRCPLPAHTDDQYLAQMIITTIFGYLGFFLGVFTFLSFLNHPLKRSFPRNLVSFQVLSAAILSLSYLIPHWSLKIGEPIYQGSMCSNAWTPATITQAACGAQSFFRYVSHLWFSLWYFVVALFLLRAAVGLKLPRILFWPL